MQTTKSQQAGERTQTTNEDQARYAEALRKCTGAVSVTCIEERRMPDGTLVRISEGISAIGAE